MNDQPISSQISDLGTQVGQVTLQIDYQIVEHFSENLYDSPNKAIEELVANGFDAFATEVRVFIPGQYTATRVLIWDNGESMDIEGLKKLWWIAKSPKLDGDRVEERDGRRRKIIGKFGIGKLASYTVGRVISHLCRHGDQFYLVSVDYNLVHGDAAVNGPAHEDPVQVPIRELARDEARSLLRSRFDTPPPSIEQMFEEESWTCAIIELLKVNDIPEGRLLWILGNGMPLRPDFSTLVNESVVQPKLAGTVVQEWDFGSSELLEAVDTRWADAVTDGKVEPIVDKGSECGLDPVRPDVDEPFIRFGHLGQVRGRVRLFDDTVLKYRSSEHGRSHGFFVMVLGRLTNPDDDKLYVPDPSYQTFYRSQFVIHADDLDSELLADRQRLRHDQAVVELELLQKALMSLARNATEAREQAEEESQSTQSILPVDSRAFYREPLSALIGTAPIDDIVDFDPGGLTVDRKDLGVDEPLAVVSWADNAIHVNRSHPYYTVLEERAGHSKAKAVREFLRAFDIFAVSERLTEGHLIDLGLPKDQVAEIMEWRDGLFRQLARSYGAKPELIHELERSSHVGGQAFERAIAAVLEDIGFVCRHEGASGREDVAVFAATGPEGYRLIVEAKGSEHDVGNSDADIAAAARHRDEAQVAHAVVVARRFRGFGDDRDNAGAAVYGECHSVGGVSLMEVDALEKLHGAVSRYSYPLPLIRKIFFELRTPAGQLAAIEELDEPLEGFDYAELLRELWRRQQDEAADDVVPYRSVFQSGRWKGSGMDFEDFELRLAALDTLAAGRISLMQQREVVYLRQSPDMILEAIEHSLHGLGHDVPNPKTPA